MQEVMNKIVGVEQQAQKIRSETLSETKAAAQEAQRQGRELLDEARRAGSLAARGILDKAQTDAEALLADVSASAVGKAKSLAGENEDRVAAAARFVMERIVDSV